MAKNETLRQKQNRKGTAKTHEPNQKTTGNFGDRVTLKLSIWLFPSSIHLSLSMAYQ
ncbi:hypothetical protein [Marinomonas dokdonensis]|uniref:hypothetical protein n=1 Tax=Marinomonas dokdonensis TaxID=328224 RepID=UPI0040558DB2